MRGQARQGDGQPMSEVILFCKSKVVLTVLGAVLFGTASALVAAGPFSNTPSSSSSSTPQGQAGMAALGDETETPGSLTQATKTPIKAPTRTPKPTNTAGKGGGPVIDVQGTVQ